VFGGGGRKRYAWGPGPVARPRFIGEGIVKVGEYRARRMEWRRLFLTLVSGHVVGWFRRKRKTRWQLAVLRDQTRGYDERVRRIAGERCKGAVGCPARCERM
jgi:hypothetical protein